MTGQFDPATPERLAALIRSPEPVEVPLVQLGLTVFVRRVSLQTRISGMLNTPAAKAETGRDTASEQVKERMVVVLLECVLDADGAPLFQSDEQVERFAAQYFAVATHLFNVADRGGPEADPKH